MPRKKRRADTKLQHGRVRMFTNFPRSLPAARHTLNTFNGHVLCPPKHTHTHTAITHTLTASLSVYTCYPTPHTHSRVKGKVSHLSPKCPSAHAFPQTYNKPSVYRSLLEGSCWMLGLVGAIFLQLLITLFSSEFHATSSWQRNREHLSNAIGGTGALVPVSPCVKTRSDGSETSRHWDPKACQ